MTENLEQIFVWFGGVIAVGGSTAAVAFGLFKLLGTKWIEARFAERLESFRHEQAKELARLRVEVDSAVNGALKLQEREFAALPELWGKISAAYGEVLSLASPFQSYPNVGAMTDQELSEFLQASSLTKSHRDELLSAHPTARDDAYQRIIFWYRLREARRAMVLLEGCLRDHALFLQSWMKQECRSLCELLYGVLDGLQVAHEVNDFKLRASNWERLNADAPALIDALEQRFSERLHVHGAGQRVRAE